MCSGRLRAESGNRCRTLLLWTLLSVLGCPRWRLTARSGGWLVTCRVFVCHGVASGSGQPRFCELQACLWFSRVSDACVTKFSYACTVTSAMPWQGRPCIYISISSACATWAAPWFAYALYMLSAFLNCVLTGCLSTPETQAKGQGICSCLLAS
jgi:hypothetical protein